MTSPLPLIDIDPLAPPPPRIVGDGSRARPAASSASSSTPRPRGVHTKHLTELDRFRVRTLYYDAGLSKGRIRQVTGYSASQVRTAVRARSAAVGRRPGRPRKEGGKGKEGTCELGPCFLFVVIFVGCFYLYIFWTLVIFKLLPSLFLFLYVGHCPSDMSHSISPCSTDAYWIGCERRADPTGAKLLCSRWFYIPGAKGRRDGS